MAPTRPADAVEIRRDDLTGAAIRALLDEHLAEMRSVSPPCCVHALDLDGLRDPAVSFWSMWHGEVLLGCAALKELDPAHGEVKSMRIVATHRGGGLGARMVHHLLDEARRRGYRRVSLETGSQPHFFPAHRLYRKHGFVPCGPFGSYRDDPNSCYFSREL